MSVNKYNSTSGELERIDSIVSVDSAPTSGSTNPISSGGVYTALANKQDTLTFDDVPTDASDNPVKSGGVYNSLADKQAKTLDTSLVIGGVSQTTVEGSLGALSTIVPVGVILPYGGASAPTGWFLCQGQAMSRTEYADLFAVIGTAFGTGDGSTTFNLPDLTGKTVMGAETGHTLGTSENGALPNITGEVDYGAAFANYFDYEGSFDGQNDARDFYKTTGDAGGVSRSSIINFNASRSSNLYKDGQTKVDPANARVNYIIKAK